MKSLYLLTTKGLGDYYVIAENPFEAQHSLISIFNEQNYGTSDTRNVVNIKILTKSFGESLSDNNKPFLSDKNCRLLIVDDWVNNMAG